MVEEGMKREVHALVLYLLAASSRGQETQGYITMLSLLLQIMTHTHGVQI